MLRCLAVILACAGPLLAAEGPSQLEIVDVENSMSPRARGQALRPVCRSDDPKLVRRLWEKQGKTFDFKDWGNFGPDSSYRRIRLEHQGKAFTLESWHPQAERAGTAVAMSYGVTALNGRSKAQALKLDKPEYVAKRSAFDAIVERCLSRRNPR